MMRHHPAMMPPTVSAKNVIVENQNKLISIYSNLLNNKFKTRNLSSGNVRTEVFVRACGDLFPREDVLDGYVDPYVVRAFAELVDPTNCGYVSKENIILLPTTSPTRPPPPDPAAVSPIQQRV